MRTGAELDKLEKARVRCVDGVWTGLDGSWPGLNKVWTGGWLIAGMNTCVVGEGKQDDKVHVQLYRPSSPAYATCWSSRTALPPSTSHVHRARITVPPSPPSPPRVYIVQDLPGPGPL